MSWYDYFFEQPTDRLNYNLSQSVGKYKYIELIDQQVGEKNYQPTIAKRKNQYFNINDVIYEKTSFRTHKILKNKKKNITNITFMGNNNQIDSVIFYDEYKGGRRINLTAHGSLSKNYYGEDVSGVVIGGETLYGDELANMLQDFRDQSPFESVRLLSCQSGEGGRNSLISKVSGALKVPVKGYEGTILGFNEDYMSTLANQYGTEKAKDILKEEKMFGRSLGVNEVVKGSGRYMRQGNTMMAGMEFF